MVARSIAEAWPPAGQPSRSTNSTGMPDDGRPVRAAGFGPGGRYEERGRVHGTTTFRALKPFAVDVVPARLVEGVLPP